MRDINRVVLVGRLTRDADFKVTNSGLQICNFSVAVNRTRKDGDQFVDEANFFDCEYFGRSAEAVNRYLVKGKQVAIDGELRQQRWEQDGQPRNKVVVNVRELQLLGGGDRGSSGGSDRRSESPYSSTRQQSDDTGSSFEDDVPF
ncbi:MAG: single-stranded DNA-binding protein [Spirochaetota bacterium]